MNWRTAGWIAGTVCGLLALVPGVSQAVPQVNNITPRGLQAGGTTTVVIEGAELLPDPRLLLPIPIAAQTVREGATDGRVEIDVTLDAAAPGGIHLLRLGSAKGISNALPVGVDQLPQSVFAPEITALPVALHGALTGSTVLATRFMGQAGQRIVVDVEAKRLGGALNPVVRIMDARRLQLAWAQGTAAQGGDARLAVTLPAEGAYLIELHDALYRGDNPGHFRMKIGDLASADLAFPLGAQRGTIQPLELIGAGLPPGTRTEANLTAALGDSPAPWPQLPGMSGSRPLLMVSDYAEAVEAPPADGTLQQVALPAGFNGRLLTAHEEDRFKVLAPAGTTMRLDVFANRVGSPLDGVLTVYNEQGAGLASNDDRPGTIDPGVDVVVPADAQAVIVGVKDLHGRGGESFIYRVAVTVAGAPDYTLSLFEDRHHVPQGGVSLLRVRANRMGYNGPIKLSLPGLPTGLVLGGDEIPAGATDTLLTLAASELAPLQVVSSIVGTSVDPNVSLVRAALLPEMPASRLAPWLRGEVGVAVTGRGPLETAWADLSADATLPLGGKLPVTISVARGEGVQGAVRLSLVTTQVVPTKAENNQQVPDLARALRIDGTPTIAADQSSLAVPIEVPADLPEIPYDVAVAAELLSADGSQVLARVTTPARRLVTLRPSFALELAGEPKLEATAGSGATGKLTGRIVRNAGFDGDITLSLAGLPADFFGPSLVVPAEETAFEFAVAFPYGTAAGDLAGVKLVGASTNDLGMPVASNNQLDLALKVVPGGPPPALYPVFEDEPALVALLTEGDGQASLESADRYSGGASLRVTPTQKFRAALPTLRVKIAEQPGEGEFRYLRFAWKKRGGTNIVLQLNANGSWGPSQAGAAPAYRYLAGADQPEMATLKVSEQAPAEWTVVTRDLFADFGAFQLDGLAFSPLAGEFALFDHVYLAKTEADLAGCPAPLPAEQPLAIFEDQPEFAAELSEGTGTVALTADEKYSGTSSVKVTPDQRFRTMYPGLGLKIRENPAPGEYRYLTFAWRKQGGTTICFQINHDGVWGPAAGSPAKFRYDAGAGPETYGAALRVDGALPANWTLVTRDLFADFGEFTFTGLALSPQDGEFALFDHLYLGRGPRDFELAAPAAQP